ISCRQKLPLHARKPIPSRIYSLTPWRRFGLGGGNAAVHFRGMPLLRVDNLTLMYGATEVLAELTFQVEPRQRLGIVGANGSGKSSLLRAISGELTPAAGSLTLSPRPGALSGGQRRRLALARPLLQDADLLLLDGPTNHLDLEAIEWLEGFLRLSRSGMLIVSHDRRFLEHTTDDILELQAAAGEWY